MKKPIEAIIEEVVIEPHKIQPIIVNFQNGQLKDEETKKMKVGLFNDEENKKTVLALCNGKTVYKGYKPNLARDLVYTMLAIHNKKTGKVKLIQAERWDVVPVLDKHIDDSIYNSTDQIIALNKQFGSKKAKRRTEQFEKMKINIETVKDQLEQTVSHIDIQKDDLQFIKKDIEVNIILPTVNKNATVVSDIYDINNIVPNNILKTLYSKVNEALNDMEEKAEFFIKTVQYCKNDEQYTVKMAILLYIESVIFWLNNPIKFGKKSDIVACSYSSEVNNYIIESYSIVSANGRQRPGRMKDKGIIHCIILGLMIWNFKLDLELFSSMFKIRIGIKKLFELAKWAYAVQHKQDKKCIIFKLPLPSQPTKVIKKKTMK